MQYFELRNSSLVVSSFIDSGAGLVSSIWFVYPSIEQRKQFYGCEANDLGVVWCSCNEQTNRLLANCLHGKTAELCLANS